MELICPKCFFINTGINLSEGRFKCARCNDWIGFMPTPPEKKFLEGDFFIEEIQSFGEQILKEMDHFHAAEKKSE